MKLRKSISVALCSAMVMSSAPVHAGDAGAAAAGLALGIFLGQQGKKQQKQKKRVYRSNPQRQQNIETQKALNAFGFNVGRADGALGPKSRAAIGDYQDYMGYPRSGYLDDFQRSQLVDGMHRLNAGGGAAYPKVVANEGTRGLLKAFRDPNYANRYRNNGNGYADNGGYNGNDYAHNGGYNGNGGLDNSRSFSDQGGGDDLALPDLDLSLGVTPTSMATHCELVAGLTQANQGAILPVNVTDPEQALGEQFCEARGFAITETNGQMTNARFTEEQLAAYCEKVAKNMQPAISAMPGQNLKVIATKSQEIANNLYKGDMTKAADFGKLCLGTGYRRDDAEMALGGALTMVAAGKMPYSEVMGHHLRWGFGTGKSTDISRDWYSAALTSMEQGAEPAFLPSKTSERNKIISIAIDAPAGNALAPVEANAESSLELPDLSLD